MNEVIVTQSRPAHIEQPTITFVTSGFCGITLPVPLDIDRIPFAYPIRASGKAIFTRKTRGHAYFSEDLPSMILRLYSHLVFYVSFDRLERLLDLHKPEPVHILLSGWKCYAVTESESVIIELMGIPKCMRVVERRPLNSYELDQFYLIAKTVKYEPPPLMNLPGVLLDTF